MEEAAEAWWRAGLGARAQAGARPMAEHGHDWRASAIRAVEGMTGAAAASVAARAFAALGDFALACVAAMANQRAVPWRRVIEALEEMRAAHGRAEQARGAERAQNREALLQLEGGGWPSTEDPSRRDHTCFSRSFFP